MEFQKQHKCHVVVSTFKNEWFEALYPELEFVKPGDEVPDIYAMYGVGWYYNEDNTVNTERAPRDFKPIPLQATSTWGS